MITLLHMITNDNITTRVTVARLIFIVYIGPLTTMIVFTSYHKNEMINAICNILQCNV